MTDTFRELGRTGIKVSTVTMGCWAIVGDATWGPQSEQDAVDAIHAALDLGVNCFDSAEMYGNGYSEQILAKALAGKRSRAVLCSKFSPQHANSWDDLLGACNNSLKNLGTDYLDVYYLHWPNRQTPIEKIAGWCDDLRRQGKIRAFAVSNFGVDDLGDLLKVAAPAVNQLPYNLLWRVVENEILPLCRRHDVSVACYSPIAQGLLTGKFADADAVPESRGRTRHFSRRRPQTRHQEDGQEEATFAAIRAIAAIADDLSCPMAELALAWLIHQPGIATVIAGARNPGQMAANAKAMDRTLTPETIARLNAATEPLKTAFGNNPDMWQSAENSRFR